MPVPLVRLRPGRTTAVTYPVPTAPRGVIEVGPLEISRRDPLGAGRGGAPVRRLGHASGYARAVHPIAAVPVGLSRSMDGRVDRVPQGSITFAALREYVVGDDLRHVHWRTSARVGELMVREHVDTSLPRVVILLDDRAEAHVPMIGRRVHLRGRLRGGGVGAGRRVPRGHARRDPAGQRDRVGRSATARSGPLLDLLAEADPAPGHDLAARGRSACGCAGSATPCST